MLFRLSRRVQRYPPQENELTRTELSAIYKSAAKNTWATLGISDPTKSSSDVSSQAVTVPDEGNEVTGVDLKFLKANACSMIAIVNLVGDYYLNENFEITSDAVSFAVNYMSVSCTMTLLPILNEAEKNLSVEMLLSNASAYTYYYNFDIGYDFDTDTLLSFRILVKFGQDTYQGQWMKNDGKFYMADEPTSEFKTVLDSLYTDFLDKKTNGKALSGDFQKELDTYTEVSQKARNLAINGQI